jgi:Quinohemoprotein amine dehydrogenase, alpha subunit domain III
MRSLMKLGAGLAGVVALAMGCGSGSAGPAGQNGTNGTDGQNGAPGAQGPAGPAGPAGNTSPSISAMIPRVGVLDREFDAVVIGNETAFDNTTQVDLGQGVTVTKLTVASPTALFFHVAVDKAAATGAHDLKVTGASAATVTGMLSVVPAMGVTVSAGTTAQGALAQIDLTDNDATGFAANNGSTIFQLQGGLFTFQNFIGGVVYQTPGAARYIVGLDPLATPGPLQPIGVNAYFNQTAGQYAQLTTFYSDPNALTVTAASPKAVTIGTAIANENLSKPLADNVYHVTTDGTAQVTQLTFTLTSGSQLSPAIFALPTSGKYAQMLYPNFGNPAVISVPSGAVANDFYVVAMDQQFRGGQNGQFGYSVTSAQLPAANVPEQSTGHATEATAQNVANSGVVVISGAISGGEVDVYNLTGLPSNGTCSPFNNMVFTAQSDVCIAITQTTQIDQAVQAGVQGHFCNGPTLGTGFQTGVFEQFCEQQPGSSWAVAIYPRYQAQVPTGAYTIGLGY